MTIGSLFSGIGGFDEAFRRAGYSTAWLCEIDDQCNHVLRRHFPGVPNFHNVTAFAKLLRHYRKTSNYAALDKLRVGVLCGGSPCQDLSVAGKRKGMAGERSGLFRDMVRICRILRPGTVVWENVAGALSSCDGQDFAAVIGYFTGIIPCVPADGWGNAGIFKGIPGMWNVGYRVLDAQHFGVPQRRRRIVLVASLGTARCAEILFEPESLRGNPAPGREAREGITGSLSARIEGGGGLGTDFDIGGGLIHSQND